MIPLKASLCATFRIVPAGAAILCALLLQACSIDLTTFNKADMEFSDTKPIFKEINLYYAGQKQALPNEALQAYSSVFDTLTYPASKCYATADIIATVDKATQKKGSAWYIGAIIIPFWPIQPVNEDWTYNLTATVYCEETIIHNFEFTESTHIQAFWFGSLRSDLVNQASQEMHRKFIERLKFETSDTRQADLNSASDYIQ